MIRIAVIIAKMDSGGQKSLVMEYYRHIDRSKIQFDFICDSDSNAIPDEEILRMGGRVYRIPPYQNIFANMREMKNICKENQYPIMHAYNNTMNIFPMFIAKITGIPIRISESLTMAHSGDKKTILKKILRPLSRLFANYYISNCIECGRWQFGKKFFDSGKVDVFKTSINTKYNAFNKDIRIRTRKEYGWEDKIVVGHIGRFAPQKNTLRVIDIFASVVKKESNAVLCLIGDGVLREKVLKKIKELEISDHVNYFGRREDIQQFYNAMDCFLLPSLYEGLPVVGIEAQTSGLPVFFSTEITREAEAVRLCHFMDLSETNEKWAEEILKAVRKNMPIRRDYSKEVVEEGFDSESEALRLQNYYMNAMMVNSR